MLLASLPHGVQAQIPDFTPYSWLDRETDLPRHWAQPLPGNGSTSDARSRGIYLFRIPAYLGDPVGLDQDDPTNLGLPSSPDSGPDWLQFAMGNDNPYFDLRRRGDPGGVGYYKIASQVQLFDSPKTGCSLALQGVTPAGLEQGGNADGATVFRPAITLFHELNDGTGLQGFVGRQMRSIPSAAHGSIKASNMAWRCIDRW